MPSIAVLVFAVALGALLLGLLLVLFVKRASTESVREQRQVGLAAVPEPLPEYTPDEFRHLLVDLLEALGMQATSVSEHGEELEIYAKTVGPLTGGRYIVLAFREPEFGLVDSPIVLKLIDTVKAEEAQKGILITSRRFSDEARKAAQMGAVEIIDGEALRALLGKYLGK